MDPVVGTLSAGPDGCLWLFRLYGTVSAQNELWRIPGLAAAIL